MSGAIRTPSIRLHRMHTGFTSILKVTLVQFKGKGLIFNLSIAASAVFVGIAVWTRRQF